MGLIAALYLALIGLTGSILVFRYELALLTVPAFARSSSVRTAHAADVAARIQERYPGQKLRLLYPPGVRGETYVAVVGRTYVYADPATGEITGELEARNTWLNQVADLHGSLMLGRGGRLANAIGAALLCLLAVTGLATRSKSRHSTIGVWAFASLMTWGLTAIYFTWPAEIEALLRKTLPARPRLVTAAYKAVPGERLPLRTLLDIADRAMPKAPNLTVVSFPSSPTGLLFVMHSRESVRNASYSDYAEIDPYTGKVVRVVETGYLGGVADKVIALLGPVHFGNQWGFGVQIIWCLLGLSLPALAFTGLKRMNFRRFRKSATPARTRAEV